MTNHSIFCIINKYLIQYMRYLHIIKIYNRYILYTDAILRLTCRFICVFNSIFYFFIQTQCAHYYSISCINYVPLAETFPPLNFTARPPDIRPSTSHRTKLSRPRRLSDFCCILYFNVTSRVYL